MSGQFLLSVEEALTILLSNVSVLEPERISLDEARSRVLAELVTAERAQPPAALSAMDGYAIRQADWPGPFEVIGASHAGAPFAGKIGPAQTVRIMTGAIVPRGADRVVIQEVTVIQEARLVLTDEASPDGPCLVRPVGHDFDAGQRLLKPGTRLGPAQIALAAAANCAEVDVFRAPRVRVLASGDELCEPGSVLGDSAIVDAASYGVAGIVAAEGGVPVRSGILPDDETRADAMLREVLARETTQTDLLVLIGGASVGDRDLLRPLIEGLGGDILFAGVAMRPGKPTWSARFNNGPMVLGLPGNPASALACAHVFLAPLLKAIQGGEPGPRFVRARLEKRLAANGPRETYLRGTHCTDEAGTVLARADERQDSGLLTPFAAATALIRRLPGAPAAEAGEPVDLLLL